ncbi:MAG: hypothetical protein GXY36_12335 [Chloroflexi bacterium]|jgi:hypothetical protein|nr:hypothetical protein [Chloroflexota bacterium]
MAWTVPRTWITGELITAAQLNAHLRDNLNALKQPPSAVVTPTSTRTTSSTVFVPVDEVHFAHTLTTAGGDVLIGCWTTAQSAAGLVLYLDVAVDGVRLGQGDGIQRVNLNGSAPLCFAYLLGGLSAGVHTLTLMWRVSTGSASLVGGMTQFWAREVS